MIAQIMLLHQVAKLANSCFVRGRFPAQVDTDELAHGTRIVKGFLSSRIREAEPVLQETGKAFSAGRITCSI